MPSNGILRAVAAAFFLLYAAVMGISPAQPWWTPTWTTPMWRMYSEQESDQAHEFWVHFPNGREEHIPWIRERLRTYFYRSGSHPVRDSHEQTIGILIVTVDSARFGPPHFCRVFPDAAAISFRTPNGFQSRVPCLR